MAKKLSLILDKTSEFINKWLEESCVEFEKEIEVSGNSESYFVMKVKLLMKNLDWLFCS